MTETVTITHHAAKPEYQWELVVPEGPTVLLSHDKLFPALEVLGLTKEVGLEQEIQALPNGGSRSVNADLSQQSMQQLSALGVKTFQQS